MIRALRAAGTWTSPGDHTTMPAFALGENPPTAPRPFERAPCSASVETHQMATSSVTLLPPTAPEVFELWLRGDYAGGLGPSAAYDRLGWSLMVRGFYRYEVTQDPPPKPTDPPPANPKVV